MADGQLGRRAMPFRTVADLIRQGPDRGRKSNGLREPYHTLRGTDEVQGDGEGAQPM